MSLRYTHADALDVVNEGNYSVGSLEVNFREEQQAAEEGTRVYSPDELASLRSVADEDSNPRIEVIDATAQIAAKSLSNESTGQKSPVAILNFAAAKNPGGGFLYGNRAQEEELCLCSGLYNCLQRCKAYYEANEQEASFLYTDYAIYSPAVPFFKTSSQGNRFELPFLASVITSAAPNTKAFLQDEPDETEALEQAFLRRWQNVLCIARDQGVTRLLLGAWGCGAFGGDPFLVAKTAKRAIGEYGKGFQSIVFAIPNFGHRSELNFRAFQRTLAE